MDSINGSTRLYFILGDPIAQVKSPAEFNRLFASRGKNAAMLPIHVSPEDFDAFIIGLSAIRNVDGIVLTVPHKFSGLRHCTRVSERSHLLQAVNVMRRSSDNTWQGDMVDGIGYVDALKGKGCEIEDRHALVVGAGGAGTAIAEALLRAGIGRLAVYDQNDERQGTLMSLLSRIDVARVVAGSTDPSGFDVVINATPMGMREDDPLPVDATRLKSSMFIGDVITVPAESPLLVAAQALTCQTLNGTEMYAGVLTWMDRFFCGLETRA